MTMRERQRQVQLYRGQVPSPGRPTTAWRQDRVRFWAAIGRGASSEDAALAIGVSQADLETFSSWHARLTLRCRAFSASMKG